MTRKIIILVVLIVLVVWLLTRSLKDEKPEITTNSATAATELIIEN